MRKPFVAALAFAVGAAIATPLLAQAPITPTGPEQLLAQGGPESQGWQHRRGGPEGEGGRWGGGPGMGPGGPGMEGPGMRGHHHGMMAGMMMRRSPQEWCEERLARRAGMRAYVGAKLKLTDEQRPLWDKLEAAAQTAEGKQRQFCATLKPRDEAASQTLLDRTNRREQFLSVRLEAIQSEKPALQALYQALTPEQKAIIDRPFPHRG